MTKRLYDNGNLTEFSAIVLACTPEGEHWAVSLDQTAFFPGGGGQAADVGRLDHANVITLREEGTTILHITDAPLAVGQTVCGKLDPDIRLRRMQNHSGEHILSGLFSREHGLNNVGFHMGSEDVTLDLDGVLTREQITDIETAANRIIAANLPVSISYPSSDELPSLAYRSKLDLTEGVRIVSIGENGIIDRCACCAPHVAATGQIGIIKILDIIHYKGGLRLHILCGLDALDDYRQRYTAIAEIAASLSAKQQDAAAAVARLNDELSAEKAREASLRRRLTELHAAAIPNDAPYALIIEPTFAPGELRHLVNAALPHTPIAIACTGCDAEGYGYVLGSSNQPLRALCAEMHAALGGRGGGSDTMVQGKLPCDIATLQTWLNSKFK